MCDTHTHTRTHTHTHVVCTVVSQLTAGHSGETNAQLLLVQSRLHTCGQALYKISYCGVAKKELKKYFVKKEVQIIKTKQN